MPDRVMARQRLRQLADALVGRRILVVGDLMLDEYLWGQVNRISPEAPIPIVDVQRVSLAPGGAANVAANVVALGGQATLVGVVGDDEAGQRLRLELAQRDISAQVVVDPSRPTTLKSRVMAHQQQVVRVDRENRQPIDGAVAAELLDQVMAAADACDVILISDYGKGVVASETMAALVDRAQAQGRPLVVDPKGADFSKYRGATIITPNQGEAGRALGKEVEDEAMLEEVMRGLLDLLASQAVLVTRGELGMALLERDGSLHYLPALARQVYDVTGAGDTVVGTLALALAAGASFLEAVALANYAAGVVVGKLGTATVGRSELKRAVMRP